MVSIHRPLGYGPRTIPLRHSALSHPRWDSNPQSLGSLNFQLSGLLSRGWFRSIDIWVMGPARFCCATLLFLPAGLLLAPGLSLQKYILENNESQAFCCLV